MTKSQEILLSLCRSYLNGCGVDVSVDLGKVNWCEVFDLAQEQAVAGVVFEVIQREYDKADFSALGMETKLEWFALQKQIEQRNVNTNKAVCKLMHALGKKNIRAVLLKGQGLAYQYSRCLGEGQDKKRQSGDIDVYVGKEEYAETVQLMIDNGWKGGEMRDENLKHCVLNIDGVMVEVHRFAATVPGIKHNYRFQKMMGESRLSTSEGFFANEKGEIGCDRGVFVKTLPEVENVIFTFTHMFSHLLSGGMLLRQLMDVVVALKYLYMEVSPKEAARELEMKLKSIGYLRTWQVFGCIMVKYLGVKPEDYPCYNSRYEHKAESVLDEMFRAAQQRKDMHQDKERKKGLAHYLWVCGKYFRVVSIFPYACFYAFSYMVADVTAKHFYRKKGW